MAEGEEKVLKEERDKATSILRVDDPTLKGGRTLTLRERSAAERAVNTLTPNEHSFLTTIRDSHGTFLDHATVAAAFRIQPALARQREMALNAKLIDAFEKALSQKGRLAETR